MRGSARRFVSLSWRPALAMVALGRVGPLAGQDGFTLCGGKSIALALHGLAVFLFGGWGIMGNRLDRRR